MKFNTEIEYCLVEFKMSNQTYYCLWFSDNRDAFLIDENEKVIMFYCEDEMRAFCKIHNLDIQVDAAVLYDIDAFMEKICLNDIDCNLILRFWNIASDMAYTLKESFIGDDDGMDCVILDVYNKLFYGTNPPALKKDSPEVYIPKWTKEERLILSNVMDDAIRIFYKYLK